MNSNSKLQSLLIIVFLGLTLSRCNYPLIDPPVSQQPLLPTSGVHGQVLKAPIHSGPPEAGDSNFIGFGALFYVQDDRGQQVATFNSDSFGWFTLQLKPGQYEIIPDNSAPLKNPALQRQQVTVTKDEFSNVVLRFNTDQ